MVSSLVAIVSGSLGVLWVLSSVVRTVVIPRPERVWLTAAAFEGARRLTDLIARPFKPQRRHQLRGAFAPIVLISLPLLWSIGLFASFALIYWGLGPGSLLEAFELSGSSFTTLGISTSPNTTSQFLAMLEALMGLAIVALMIAFLPTLYGTFSRREIAVGRLTTRAGEPPDPVTFISRLEGIGQLDDVGDRWEEWEDWFVELGETHTTFPALIYFRSARPERSWISAAEVALDTAALLAALGLTDGTGRADTMIRSGYLALRSVADYYRIEPEAAEFSGLSISPADFEHLLDNLETVGIEYEVARAEAWNAFAGWRVNYDRSICGLRERIGDVHTHWNPETATPNPRNILHD